MGGLLELGFCKRLTRVLDTSYIKDKCNHGQLGDKTHWDLTSILRVFNLRTWGYDPNGGWKSHLANPATSNHIGLGYPHLNNNNDMEDVQSIVGLKWVFFNVFNPENGMVEYRIMCISLQVSVSVSFYSPVPATSARDR